ncbi:MAG: DUF4838 domain-containing protein [Planctomycetota bacterium]|nr:DUF4838 domain-containing protein [Planctomycetota bacterium]
MKAPSILLILLLLASNGLWAEIGIYLPKDPPSEIVQAGDALAFYLPQIYGREATVYRSDADSMANTAAIYVSLTGSYLTRRFGDGRKQAGPETFEITSVPTGAWFTGTTPLAIRHATFTFLEKLGCRWYFPGKPWEVIPRIKKLEFPEFNLQETPDYQTRRIWYGWGIGPIPENAKAYSDWVIHNRMGGSLTGSTGHAYAAIARGDLDFEEHPEWFPLINGKRTHHGQICISNPQIRVRAIERALDFFSSPTSPTMISMSPNDGAGWCECTGCKDLGSTTDQALWLANQVADAIREKHPDKLVAMYGYAGTSIPPNIKARDNVIIFVATAFNKAGLDESLEGWSKKAKYIGIRDYYNVIIWNRDMPRWQIDKMRQRIPYYYQRGAIAMNAESGNQWAPEGLNYYIASKLLWNTEADVDALLEDFYVQCWGLAAPVMKRYYERFKTKRISTRVLGLCLQDLDEASRLDDSPEVQNRIDMFKLYYHWMRLYFEHNQISGGEESIEAVRKIHHFAWRIRTTNMIHSYAQFRERRLWRVSKRTPKLEIERWKTSDAPLDAPAQPKANLTSSDPDQQEKDEAALDLEDDLEASGEWEAINEKEIVIVQPPPMFTHAEIQGMFKDDLAQYGHAVEVDSPTYSDNLVQLPSETPGATPVKKASPRYRISNSFVFAGKRGEAVTIRIQPGFVRKVAGKYIIRAIDDMKPLIEGKLEGDKPYDLAYLIPESSPLPGRGHASLSEITFECGGMASNIDFGKRHYAWVLKEGGRAHVIGGSGRQFFFVPKGTKSFAVAMTTSDGWGQIEIRDAKGEIILDKKGNYSPGEEFGVTVPAGSDGAVWSFQISRCEDAAGIYLLGVPPYAAASPELLLVPAECLGSGASAIRKE